MAQPAPRIINLSTLWSDGTGATPTGAGYTQIIRQPNDTRYDDYLKSVTNGFNKNVQSVAQYGRIQLTGDLPHGYTLWSYINPGGSETKWLYGHPSANNYRSATNFSDHIPEMLAANHTKENQIRLHVRTENPRLATRTIIRYNHTATTLIHPLNYAAARDLPGFVELDENTEIARDRGINPTIPINCSCVFR